MTDLLFNPDAYQEGDDRDNWSGPLRNPEDDRIGRFSNPEVSGAPETQRLAAIQVYPKTGTQRRKVLDALFIEDLTDEQIEDRIHIGQRQSSTRRKELENDGWVMDSGDRRKSKAGADVVVWALTPSGREQYLDLS